ncbi:MAG: hypothetical protein WCO10_00185 [bacterium]
MPQNTNEILTAFNQEIIRNTLSPVKQFECPTCKGSVKVTWSVHQGLVEESISAAMRCNVCNFQIESDGVQVPAEIEAAIRRQCRRV